MACLRQNVGGGRRRRTGALVVLVWVGLFLGGARAWAADTVEIALHQNQTDVLYLHAGLGGSERSEFLFDTGSGYLVIADAELAALRRRGEAEYLRRINARLAAGQLRQVAIYRISSLDLGADCVLHNVEAAVLPGARRNILGMNVLKRVDSFSVSFNPTRLVLRGCQRQSIEKVAGL